MPYIYQQPEKTSSLAVLAFVRDRAEAGHCSSVYSLRDFLASVKYATPKHRLNDASVRLRTLEKSGYLRKVSKDYVSGDLTAASAAQEIALQAGAGRPPAIYAITPSGMKYALTIADAYLGKDGKEIPREDFMRQRKDAWVALAEGPFRVIGLAPTEEKATNLIYAWAKKDEKPLKILKVIKLQEDTNA